LVDALNSACSIHYTVVGKATTGLEAVTLVKALKPQLLLLDLHMPGMDGVEALKQIVPMKTTAVVIMTADADPVKAREVMEIGANGYILKPWS